METHHQKQHIQETKPSNKSVVTQVFFSFSVFILKGFGIRNISQHLRIKFKHSSCSWLHFPGCSLNLNFSTLFWKPFGTIYLQKTPRLRERNHESTELSVSPIRGPVLLAFLLFTSLTEAAEATPFRHTSSPCLWMLGQTFIHIDETVAVGQSP